MMVLKAVERIMIPNGDPFHAKVSDLPQLHKRILLHWL